MNSAALANKAMQVRLSISQWSARKYDRKVSSEVASKYNTDNDAGRYNKVLIAKDAIVKIQKIANAARGLPLPEHASLGRHRLQDSHRQELR